MANDSEMMRGVCGREVEMHLLPKLFQVIQRHVL